MDMRLTAEADVIVVALEGRLTGAADAARLVEAIERLLVQGKKSFLFDLSEISWVDSTGVGALVSIFETVRRQGGATRFAGLNDRLLRIMDVTKLDRVLEIYPTRSEALEAFRGAGLQSAAADSSSDLTSESDFGSEENETPPEADAKETP